MEPDSVAQRFWEVSVSLTGDEALPRDVSDEYYGAYGARLQTLLRHAGTEAHGQDLAVLLRAGMTDNYSILLEANALVRLWFTGYFEKRPNDRSGPLKAAHYRASLMWPLIGAPVPGHSAGEYGYWRDPPVLEPLGDE
jgi:hypothetical protein